MSVKKTHAKFQMNRRYGSMVYDVPKLACQALEERKKKTKLLAQNDNFENSISPEPSGISTRSKRRYVPLDEIFSHTKAHNRGTIQ